MAAPADQAAESPGPKKLPTRSARDHCYRPSDRPRTWVSAPNGSGRGGALDGGSTVPFIARYRKEADRRARDAQVATLDERLRYLRELEERRTVIP